MELTNIYKVVNSNLNKTTQNQTNKKPNQRKKTKSGEAEVIRLRGKIRNCNIQYSKLNVKYKTLEVTQIHVIKD